MSAGYVRPGSLDDALSTLARASSASVVGGATWLMPRLASRREHGDPLDALVDLGGLEELRSVTVRDGRVRLGAGVTWARIARNEARDGLPRILATVAAAVATPAVRERATFVGNILSGLAGADGPPVALALGAVVHVGRFGETERTVALEDLATGGAAPLRPDEIVTSIDLDADVRWHAWQRVASRAAVAPALASLAVVERNDGSTMVAVGAAAVACRRPEAELHVTDPEGRDAFAHAVVDRVQLFDTADAPAPWRRKVLLTLARRAHDDRHGRTAR